MVQMTQTSYSQDDKTLLSYRTENNDEMRYQASPQDPSRPTTPVHLPTVAQASGRISVDRKRPPSTKTRKTMKESQSLNLKSQYGDHSSGNFTLI